MKKVENYKLKKSKKILESIYKNGKKNIKFGDIEIKKQKLHKGKIVVSNKVSIGKKRIEISLLVKKGLKCFIRYKDA